jgi:hypothetical protein
MSGPQKLTDEQIKFAREQTHRRRECLKLARMYPTVAELAARLQCTPRYLQKVLAGKVR